jgi:hypothetical protein
MTAVIAKIATPHMMNRTPPRSRFEDFDRVNATVTAPDGCAPERATLSIITVTGPMAFGSAKTPPNSVRASSARYRPNVLATPVAYVVRPSGGTMYTSIAPPAVTRTLYRTESPAASENA